MTETSLKEDKEMADKVIREIRDRILFWKGWYIVAIIAFFTVPILLYQWFGIKLVDGYYAP